MATCSDSIAVTFAARTVLHEVRGEAAEKMVTLGAAALLIAAHGET